MAMNVQDLLDEFDGFFQDNKEAWSERYSMTFYSEEMDVVFQIEEVVFDSEDQDVQFGGRIL